MQNCSWLGSLPKVDDTNSSQWPSSFLLVLNYESNSIEREREKHLTQHAIEQF